MPSWCHAQRCRRIHSANGAVLLGCPWWMAHTDRTFAVPLERGYTPTMATIIRIPDSHDVEIPRDGMTVEEARRTLEAAGFPQVATARGSISGNVITFERESGGGKGLTA